MLRRIFSLILKEFLLLWKDRRMRMVILAPPLIQILVFSFAATFDVKSVPIGIWNEDSTSRSRELVRRFTDSTAFRLVGYVDNPQLAEQWIDSQRVTAILHIGPRFTANLSQGRAADVQMLLDGRRSNVALIIQNYSAAIIAGYNREQLGALGAAGLQVEMRAWFNPNLNSLWYIFPGLNALVVMVMAMLVTALSVARERELGTFDQLLVTPMRPLEILIGKVSPALTIGILEAFAILGIAVFAFQIPFLGSVIWFGIAFIVFLLSAIGIGLAISALSMTQQQAILGVFMFLAPAIILSGFATPIDNMPQWCKALSMLNPIRYMIELNRSLYLRNPDSSIIVQYIWPMLAIGLVTLGSATLLFTRRLR